MAGRTGAANNVAIVLLQRTTGPIPLPVLSITLGVLRDWWLDRLGVVVVSVIDLGIAMLPEQKVARGRFGKALLRSASLSKRSALTLSLLDDCVRGFGCRARTAAARNSPQLTDASTHDAGRHTLVLGGVLALE